MEPDLRTEWMGRMAVWVTMISAMRCGVSHAKSAKAPPRTASAMRPGTRKLRRSGWEKLRSGMEIKDSSGWAKIPQPKGMEKWKSCVLPLLHAIELRVDADSGYWNGAMRTI